MEKTAILFDMDGVLVDSEKVITKAAIRSLAAFGVTACEADFKPFTGMGEDRFIGGVAQKYGVVYQPEMKQLAYEIYLKLVETELVVYPGTVPALQTLLAHGHPLVLASSADRIKIDANLRVAGIMPHTFRAILSGDDVVRKKPYPDIYLAAAKACAHSPENCIVIEDALSGVKAAKAAGARCIGITTSFERGALLEAGADWAVSEIQQICAIIQNAQE